MGQMEHLLNVYATKSAKGAIADFVGYVEVRESEATMRLTQGLWLVRGSSGGHVFIVSEPYAGVTSFCNGKSYTRRASALPSTSC